MSEDKTLTKIPHFDGHYDHWSELMENLFRAKGLWSLVEIGFTEPIEGTILTEAQREQFDDARLKDHQVKHYLFQAIDRTVFKQILDRRTAKSVWDSLKRKFGGNLKVKKSLLNALRREFEVLEMKKDETITDYFARVMMVSNKMRSNGEEMPDKKIVEKILRTLTDKFTYVVVSIEESKDSDTMSIDELQSSLVVHEQKFRRPSNNDEDQVLNVIDEADLDWVESIEISTAKEEDTEQHTVSASSINPDGEIEAAAEPATIDATPAAEIEPNLAIREAEVDVHLYGQLIMFPVKVCLKKMILTWRI
ncbi:hypothetical protein GH714_021230 [Hevea brasiliensis]|uniref:DUF4219 domain-containing protein n=1 Tax=Hevea brasiliensis TaxID=3981 RepID=A0A6A6M2C4_HEVBR|nr:hypothetical protein GH714_021230 [Hevea brasiliensis]